MRRISVVTALIVLTGTTAAASPPGGGLQRSTDAIHALGAIGVQARAVGADGRYHVATSGVADLSTGRPVPPDGRFRIASAGKTFTAVVVLQLAGEGRLRLGDPVERWLPGVVRGNGNDGRRITVRQLLQHTSGLQDDIPDYATEADFQRHRYDVYSPEQLVARALANPPAAGWHYSNTGYVLLDMIIERVTGRHWWDEVRRRIVGPLGLTGTSWPGDSPAIPGPHARAYQPFEAGPPIDVTEQIIPDPGSAIISTTQDLNTFFRTLFSGRLLPPAQLAEMTRIVPVAPELAALLPGARYGLGIFQRPLPCGGTYWSHPGGWGGYLTDNGVTADGRRSVVLSVSSVLGTGPDDYVRQQHAADALVEGTLCAAGG
ncbi:serine hydrolase domain-containing protein [Actinoplanes awajinensis]|uniref:Peptide hydrolase n=1 Tax=Actinoplanes awajinensis subsp. mycoplanecinus TaxID=135947 RepID=A0A0X3UNL7_9ACTN|nr:serine hydrolase domain-containing protein [Actinoplanes awajinensis]KUL34219.1 peptide hydrolase [Actinoplanes awajinensis subsp. mycoplanecinus]